MYFLRQLIKNGRTRVKYKSLSLIYFVIVRATKIFSREFSEPKFNQSARASIYWMYRLRVIPSPPLFQNNYQKITENVKEEMIEEERSGLGTRARGDASILASSLKSKK